MRAAKSGTRKEAVLGFIRTRILGRHMAPFSPFLIPTASRVVLPHYPSTRKFGAGRASRLAPVLALVAQPLADVAHAQRRRGLGVCVGSRADLLRGDGSIGAAAHAQAGGLVHAPAQGVGC